MVTTNNFSVIYSFKVKDGRENDFVQNWIKLTQLIYEHEGSFGSRLHQIDERTFLGYAIWPDEKTFDEAKDKMPPRAEFIRNSQKECLEEVKVLYKSKIIVDLIQGSVFVS